MASEISASGLTKGIATAAVWLQVLCPSQAVPGSSYNHSLCDGKVLVVKEGGSSLMNDYDRDAWNEINDKISLIHQAVSKLMTESVDLDPGFISVVDDEFWELLA